MLKITSIIPIIGIFLGSVNYFITPASSVPVAVEQPAVPHQPDMWASQQSLYRGDVLQLHFKAPNPRYLGVVDPDGHFFYVVFPQEATAGFLNPLVSSEHFVHLTALNISTSTFKADPYIYGVTENQPVFTKSGTYTFILGDNLHTHDPGTLKRITVTYQHRIRRA
jgi:hypothetical protein